MNEWEWNGWHIVILSVFVFIAMEVTNHNDNIYLLASNLERMEYGCISTFT